MIELLVADTIKMALTKFSDVISRVKFKKGATAMIKIMNMVVHG